MDLKRLRLHALVQRIHMLPLEWYCFTRTATQLGTLGLRDYCCCADASVILHVFMPDLLVLAASCVV